MSKRKVKFPQRGSSTARLLSSGVSMSESLFRPHPRYPSHFSPLHRQTLYTVNVSQSMLHFIERMSTDRVFRDKVDRLL